MKKVLFLFMLMAALTVVGCDNSDRDVSISLPSGTYYGEQHVTLSCADPTAQITYTLDGSDPGESNLVYDSETGIDINYTSDLKASAGGAVAQAHYDIIPYGPMDATQRAFYQKMLGVWSTDETQQDNFIVDNSQVTIQKTGTPEIKSGFYLKDISGNNANIVYTDTEGKNVEVPIQLSGDGMQITVNGKTYYPDWYLLDY